jgi:hypothetical protein
VSRAFPPPPRPSPRSPSGPVLIPRGSSVGGLVKNEFLNRLPTYWDFSAGAIKPREQWVLDDQNYSAPPRVPALDATVWLVKNRQALGLPKITHLFVDLEAHQSELDGYESMAAAYYLRAKLPKEYLVTTYSRWGETPERIRPFFENDDAAAYTLYASDRILLAADPVDEWMRMAAEYEDEIESIEPDKPRTAFLSMTNEVWYPAQHPGIAPLAGTPLPVEWVRQMKARLQKPPRRNGRAYRPWDLFIFGSYSGEIAANVDVMMAPKVVA